MVTGGVVVSVEMKWFIWPNGDAEWVNDDVMTIRRADDRGRNEQEPQQW